MKINKYLKIALAVVLCLTMVLPFALIQVGAEPVNFDAANVGTGFKGKKLSILGDSISTYEGVSNDGTANSTISGNAVYYKENNDYGIVREDTWWQQAIDKLDLELCVNNSWSGSSAMGTDSTDYNCAWLNRCQQLHTASANPDYIAVYLGTIDIKNVTSGLSTFANNKDTMLSEAAGTSTSVKKFSLYIRMVNKILDKYTSAQVYLFTLLPNETQNDTQIKAMEQYNQSIRDLVTYYQGEGKEVYLVDLYNDTSITRDFDVLKEHLVNTLHPNDAGMDAITNCFLSSLVHNSGDATSPDNWREVEYDLTDVYVSGGQVNTIRSSGSTDVPFSVSLLPTRPEYDMEVKVEALNYSNEWVDITSTAYSGGTVFVRRLDRYTYWGLKITAKAVYNPKNFRWELGSSGLTSCVMDGTNYNITGTLTQNPLNLESGSITDGSFSSVQYKLGDSILLRNEEPWVVEWKAKGAFSTDNMLLSNSETNSTRSNVYLFSDNGKSLFLGYRNGYRGKYWNYGVALPSSITIDANTSHTYRLANKVNTDGTNMVYLFVDGNEIGAMNNYYIGTTAQTGDLATQNFLSGRDLEFSFLGAQGHLINDCSIEYIQVWEGGGFDTLRLQQLVDEYNNELKTSMAGAEGFDAYKTAVETAESFLNAADQSQTQEKYDTYVAAIELARNNLTQAADATKIISVELLSRNYVPIGKQTGLRIVTTPDVQKIQVGNTAQTLLTNTSSLQTLEIDGVETQVKVWLVTFLRPYKTQAVVRYRIHALKDANDTAGSGDLGDDSVTFEVSYGADCLYALEVTQKPNKTNYVVGETFDKTGMEVTAHYANGTSKVITDYTVTSDALAFGDTYVTIEYKDSNFGSDSISVNLPIDVMVNVSDLADYAVGTHMILHGYYVGVAQEGMNGDNEILVKDPATDDIIAVRVDIDREFPDYGFSYGDELKIFGTYLLDGTTNTPNKHYFQADGWGTNPYNIILSQGNAVTYALDNVVQISSWEQMQELFKVGTINEYTYLEFTEGFFLSEYTGQQDPTVVYRVHMNDQAAAVADVKCDGRSITLRSNVMAKNIGSSWLDRFELTEGTSTFPGDKSDNGMIALYTGANGTYFQLTILDKAWIDVICEINVSDVTSVRPGEKHTFTGYYAGVAQEGPTGDNELLLKDVVTDDIIAVRNIPGTFPDYGYTVGDKLLVTGTVETSTESNTPNKLYLNAVSVEVISTAPVEIEYNLDNVVEISSWAQMEELFAVGTIEDYTYLKFTGDMFFNVFTGSDKVDVYRMHMNSAAKVEGGIQLDDDRTVSIRTNVLKQNLGSDVIAGLIHEGLAKEAYPGEKLNGTLIALYTGANSAYYQLTILDESWIDITSDVVHVSDATSVTTGQEFTFTGYYVGVAQEGPNGDNELLLKDVLTDDIVAVRNVPGTFPDYGYTVGDKLLVTGTVETSTESNTPNKLYLNAVSVEVISTTPAVEYKMDNVVQISSWDQMQELFAVGAIEEYTYIKFTGDMFFNVFTGSDSVNVYRMHMNSAAGAAADIQPDGTRTVSIRTNVLTQNVGSDVIADLIDEAAAKGKYPGEKLNGTLIALYTGANSAYYQLTILDADWVFPTYDNYDAVTEVAYAYFDQGTQIQYEMSQARHINPAPEDATAQNTIYLDCSSYVNAVYRGAFGVNVMDNTWGIGTANFTNYAKDNPDAPDVVGYWENADYTTAEQISAVLAEVRGQLQVGDLLVYRRGKTSGSIGHVYIYVGNDTFLHCTGSSYVYGATPDVSYDKGTTVETTGGSIQEISADCIFTDTTHTRYLFKATTSETVYNFSLLRPMARGLYPTASAQSRMKMVGLRTERSVSVGQYNAVFTGNQVVYTITLTNTSDKKLSNVTVTEVLPDGVSFVSGDLTANGTSLNWTGNVAAGQTVTLTYTVKVTATSGLIVSTGDVCGMPMNTLTNTVSGYTAEQLASVAAKANTYAANEAAFTDPLQMVLGLYSDALDITLFDYASVQNALTDVIDASGMTFRTDTEISQMLVPNLYGGLDINSGFITDCSRTRLVLENYLAVGDIILAEYGSESVAFVYLGDGALLRITSADGTCTVQTITGDAYVSTNILVTLIAYDRYAILRPSMIG